VEKMKKPTFEAKMGVWGQFGWKKIKWWQFILGWLDNRVIRIKWWKK
jgi:hypothetical protein